MAPWWDEEGEKFLHCDCATAPTNSIAWHMLACERRWIDSLKPYEAQAEAHFGPPQK